ncbi:unnamed protein product, partial [Polarella glacialis]
KDGKEDDAGGRFAEISASARQVFCEDAVAWMENLPSCFPQGSCVITGIPDIQEISPDGKMGLPTWREWFLKVVELTLQKLPEGGYAIFIQTDVKVSEGNASRRGQSEGGYWEYVDKEEVRGETLQVLTGAPCAAGRSSSPRCSVAVASNHRFRGQAWLEQHCGWLFALPLLQEGSRC